MRVPRASPRQARTSARRLCWKGTRSKRRRSPIVAHTHRAHGATTDRELDVPATWAKHRPARPYEAGCQGCVRPPSSTRGGTSRERPSSRMPRADRNAHTPSMPGGAGTRTSKRRQAEDITLATVDTTTEARIEARAPIRIVLGFSARASIACRSCRGTALQQNHEVRQGDEPRLVARGLPARLPGRRSG
jgi:hypothetical protein